MSQHQVTTRQRRNVVLLDLDGTLTQSDPGIIGEAIAYGRQGTPMGGYLNEVGGPLTRRDMNTLRPVLSEENSSAYSGPKSSSWIRSPAPT